MGSECTLHMCLKAPSDLLAWLKLKPGDTCRYCGYREPEDVELSERK